MGAADTAVEESPVGRLDPGWRWDDGFAFTQGIAAAGLIFVSGQVAMDGDGHLVGGDDMAAQTHKAMQNLGAVLTERGASYDDIVCLLSMVTDMDRHRESYEVRAQYLRNARPASTAFEVSRLAFPRLLVEIAAIARDPRACRAA